MRHPEALRVRSPWPLTRDTFGRAVAYLTRPVDGASLAAFRFLFGMTMAALALRSLAKGWVRSQLIEPVFHFTYWPFDFVRPWPGEGMILHYWVLTAAALGLALGLAYRLSALLFFLSFAYVELLDRATYLNHYYLVALLAALLVVLPAGSTYSLDAWLSPARARATVPAYSVYLLRFQLGVVYFFAGIAKLNGDWLLRAQPLRMWLAARADLPFFGGILEEPWLAWAASWAGALFDLTIVGFLLSARTRGAAFVAVVLFHVTTGLLFPIGMFPWIMVAAATVFFAPDWPRRLGLGRWPSPTTAHGSLRGLSVAVVWCSVQLLLPLRGHFRTTPSAWDNRGFDFAWNVMVAEKSGDVRFELFDRRSGAATTAEVRGLLTEMQAQAMARDPELIRAAARELARRERERTGNDVGVRAEAYASLNGRPSTLLLDPTLDLTGPIPRGWILGPSGPR